MRNHHRNSTLYKNHTELRLPPDQNHWYLVIIKNTANQQKYLTDFNKFNQYNMYGRSLTERDTISYENQDIKFYSNDSKSNAPTASMKFLNELRNEKLNGSDCLWLIDDEIED